MIDENEPLAVTRRRFLALLGMGGTGVALVGVGPPFGAWLTGRAAPADFAALRARWREIVAGPRFEPSDSAFAAAVERVERRARDVLDVLDRSAVRTRVFADLPFTSEGNVTATYARLKDLAVAYVTPGCGLQGDATLLQEVIAGLALTHQRIYNDQQEPFGNWWHWEIGAPKHLNDTCALVYEHLRADQIARYMAAVDHFVPSPYRLTMLDEPATGANRVDLCLVVAVRGLLGERAGKVATARDALSGVFKYATQGDGFYRDGSFIQHLSIAYTGTYGVVLLGGVAQLIALLAGSPWRVDDPDREVIFDAVERSFAPVIRNGEMLECVRGRAISRWQQSGYVNGHTAIEHILRLAQGAPAAEAARWRGLAKGWIHRSTYRDFFSGASVARIALARPVVGDPDVPATPEPVAHRQFPDMDRVVHRREDWTFALSMASRQISYYECGNGENKRGWHTGDGMTYLYNDDLGQFADAFWPTVDSYRLPGITVDSRRHPDCAGGAWTQPRPDTVWVGGVTLRGTYGAVGMDLDPLLSSLRGKKSWFCLDDRVVALGAGITGTGGYGVETVVENRNLHADGTNVFVVDRERKPTMPGWSARWMDPRWAHLEGVGGYLFLEGGTVQAAREDRTGSWQDINDSGPDDPVTRRYHTLWFDHGTDPSGAAYGYVLLPGRSARRTAAVASDAGMKVLANTAEVQALHVPRLGIVAANFWKASAVAGITVDAPASVVLEEQDGKLTVAVADPTRTAATLRVEVARSGYRSAEADDTITVEHLRPEIAFVADVQGSRGATHEVAFLDGSE